MNKDYFNFLLKSKKHTFIFICLVMALGLVCGYFNHAYITKLEVSYVAIAIISVIFSFVLPVLFISFVHNKKAVDSYFALNVSRKEMVITNLVFMILSILIPFTIAASFNSGLALLWSKTVLSGTSIAVFLVNLLKYYVLSIVVISVLCIFNTTLYLLANSVFDGIVAIGAYSFVPILIFIIVVSFEGSCVYGFEPFDEVELIGLSLPLKYGMLIVTYVDDMFNNYTHDPISLVSVIVEVIGFTAISYFGLKKHFVERKTERAESISNEFFSYPFLIYFYTAAIVVCSAFTVSDMRLSIFRVIADDFIFFAFIFVCFIIANFVYKRKIKISKENIIFFVVTMIVSLVFASIAFSSKGFGLANNYEKSYKNVAVEFYEWNYKNGAANQWLTKEASEITDTLLTKYPTMNEYQIRIETGIREKDMNSHTKLISYFEKLREDSIDNHYKKEVNINYANLVITCNLDENLGFTNGDRYNYNGCLGITNINDLEMLYEEGANISIYLYDYNGEVLLEYEDFRELYLKEKAI